MSYDDDLARQREAHRRIMERKKKRQPSREERLEKDRAEQAKKRGVK